MNNIKKYNEQRQGWDILASGSATGISTTNPKFLNEGEAIISVDTAMERLRDDLSLAQGNISWLALHGGGGSGGNGGSSGNVGQELTTTITVNGKSSGKDVIMGTDGLVITFSDISVKYNKGWEVVLRVGSTQVYSTTINASNTTIYVSYNTIATALTNHTGRLSVSASYNDDNNSIYGQGTWSGNILDNSIEMSCEDENGTIATLDTTYLRLYYSVGIVGKYKLTLNIKGQRNTFTKEYDLQITSTSKQLKSIILTDLFSNDERYIDTYNITFTLQNQDNLSIEKSTVSSLTLVSTEILISSKVMSTDINNPTEVNIDGSINLVFTAYVTQYTSYTYSVKIGSTFIRQNIVGIFSQEVDDYISVANKDWAIADQVSAIQLSVISGTKSATVTYYVKFVKSSISYLDDTASMKNNLIFKMSAREYSIGEHDFDYTNDKYQVDSILTSRFTTNKPNVRSVITVGSDYVPYFRLSNGASGRIDSFNLNGTNYTFSNLISALGDEFTLQIHYHADYHPDDNRTILYCGQSSLAQDNLGDIMTGISIDAHGLYINNENVLQLEDQVDNDITITCKRQETLTQTDNGPVTINNYLVKVYLDGVASAIRSLNTPIQFGNTIYYGCRQYLKDNVSTLYNLCDTNIYSIKLYTHALSEYDIMIDNINNKVATTYINGNPNYDLIAVELKKNFCTRNPDGSVKSYMYDETSGYNVDFLLNSNNQLDQSKINDLAGSIGVPIMLIDVSNDSAWTFNQFVKQQSTSSSTLQATSNKTIQYWDPVGISGDSTGIDNTIKTINKATIELQGTSTLADAVKNINISIPDDSMFVPKSTWMPEQIYTLKADVVDSSHANNASIGNFINTELGMKGTSNYFPFANKAIDNLYNSNYVKEQQPTATLKHTVEGFPVFLIMKFFTDSTNKVSTTPLGIYSFNLGRNAYRNLGFKSVTSITDQNTNTFEVKTFPFYKDKVTFNETEESKITANWIEIGDTISLKDMQNVKDSLPEDFNSSNGDFWQSDSNILNSRFEVRYPSGKQASQCTGFVQFVKNIMQFPIERCFSSDSLGAVTSNYISGRYNLYTVDAANNYSATGEQCIIQTDSNSFSQDNLGFNIESAFKYFIICNYFGLVDNFGKNSTYRSWDDQTYYVDFYDLDTALGGDNQGQLSVEPDVWIKYLTNTGTTQDAGEGYRYVSETFNKDEALSKSVVSANTNKLWLSLDTSFSRAVFNSQYQSEYTYYWYNFRDYTEKIAAAAGYDTFMNYFIDKYFNKQTENCGSLVFNYDYKLKYMLQFTSDELVSTKDLTKLHGRKVAHNRAWLKKHIIFLDSLFKWRDTAKQQQAPTFKSNVEVATGNSVYGTSIDILPVTTNCPVISKISVGNTVSAFYFLEQNQETFVNVGNIASSSPFNWNITNSNNFIKLGNDQYELYNMNINLLASTKVENSIDANGFPALSEINLQNNKTFSPDFTLDVFQEASVSEIRKMDFSNTQCYDPTKQFVLNIEQNYGTSSAFTKFTKLTDINITNAKCISNIYIPTNIPLMTLQIAGSNIQSFNLKHQAYLNEIVLDGCNNLNKVYIEDCDSYTTLNLTGFANLTEVKIINCNKVEQVIIDSNNQLRIVDIEQCPNIKSVIVTNNKALIGGTPDNYLTLSGLTNLQHIDLGGNVNLKQITIDNCNQDNIDTLYLNNTIITNRVGGNSTLLDISDFDSLKQFKISSNPKVQNIRFSNIQEKPNYLSNTFKGCTNLERIYGNFVITGPSIFTQLSKFSLHGSDINSVKFLGKSILDNGRVMMPYEIDRPEYKAIEPPSDWTMPFQEGIDVTNLTFGEVTQNNSFRETKCTIFDIYYLVSNKGSLTDFGDMFWYCLNAVFNRTSSVDNSPNRYMFYFATGVTSLYCFISQNMLENVRLFSPEHDNTNVIKDNGLFSPLVDSLVNFSNYNSSFGGVFDRFLFRHSSKNYKINTLSNSLNGGCIVDNVNTIGFIDIKDDREILSKNGGTGRGNLIDFTKNLDCVNYSGCVNVNFIDFSTIRFDKNVTTVSSSFSSTYGTGQFAPTAMFEHPDKLIVLNAFSCSTAGATTVTCNIDNNFFNGFINLQYINHTSDQNGNYMFGGGYNKVIVGEFPEDIFINMPNLVTVRKFFTSCTAPTMVNTPKLPGNLFQKNTGLRDVMCLFRDVQFDYTMSGGGFSNCPNLSNVAYLFGNSQFSMHNLQYIPHKLLYHGENNYTNTYYGIPDGQITTEITYDSSNVRTTTYTITRNDGTIYTMSNRNGALTWRNSNGDIINSPEGTVYFKTVVSTKSPRTAINNCSHMFENNNIQPYVNESPEELHYDKYQPYTWLYSNGVFTQATNYCNIDNTILFSYDGVTQKDGVHDGDDEHDRDAIASVNAFSGGTVLSTLNYCCPSDLFRYSANSCNIEYTFANCGWQYNVGDTLQHGLFGRIPPTLLIPFRGVNKSINYLFYACDKLSRYYSTDLSENFSIPKSFFKNCTEIQTASSAFATICLYKGTNLSAIQDITKSKLNDISNMFGSCRYVSDSLSDPVVIDSVFVGFNNIANMAGCFNSSIFAAPYYVKFNTVFTANKYKLNTAQYSQVFYNYTSGNCIHEQVKTLPDNNITKNYTLRQ